MPQRCRINDWEEAIINRGYRELAKVHHPDQGGSRIDFEALKEAHERLTADLETRREIPHRKSGDNGHPKGVELKLEIAHISTLLTGKPVAWTSPEGFTVVLVLSGGPGGLVADAVAKLVQRYI